MNNMTKVGVGGHTIELSESILHRLDMLKDCGYMKDEIDKVISFIIEMYQGIADFGENVSAEDGMAMITLLNEVKKDYAFLSTLKVEKENVFDGVTQNE